MSRFDVSCRCRLRFAVVCAFLAQIGWTQAATVAHWTFENGVPDMVASGSGSVLDSSGNGHHGDPINGPVYRLESVGAGSVALEFDGSNDRVFIPDAPGFQLTQSITIEAWVTLDSFANPGIDQLVFRGDSRSGFDPYFLSVLDGRAFFHIADASNVGVNLASAAPLPTGQPVHVAGTLDDASGTMSVYVDGVLSNSTTTAIRPAGVLTGPTPGVALGNLQDSGVQYLDGRMHEARISDVALPPSQFLIPEPTVFCLLGVGGLLILGRRRCV